MMQLFAEDLQSSLSSQPPSQDTHQQEIGVDIGVNKLPYFIDKAKSIEESGSYPKDTPQVHLTGFDTLIRILDPKYYPPTHSLSPLEPFLAKHRLRVTYRTDDQWGAQAAQDGYLAELGEGNREKEGGKREWVREGRIEMVEGRKEGEVVVSSTRVREAVKEGDRELLGKLVTDGVAEWILEEELYRE
jgi:nicotinamide-nucleotide adenylyltransferase